MLLNKPSTGTTYLSLFYLCFDIFARFGRYEEWSCWSVQEGVSLTLNVCSCNNIAQFFKVELWKLGKLVIKTPCFWSQK